MDRRRRKIFRAAGTMGVAAITALLSVVTPVLCRTSSGAGIAELAEKSAGGSAEPVTLAVKQFSAPVYAPIAKFLCWGDSLEISFLGPGDSVVSQRRCRATELSGNLPGLAIFPDSLTLDARTVRFGDIRRVTDTLYPHPQIAGLEVASIVWWSRPQSAPALSRPVRIAGGTAVSISADEFITGAVCVVRGDVSIAGEVSQSVISLGGSVNIDSGAVVRGNVIAFGGRITRHSSSRVYGDQYSESRIDNAQRRNSARGLAARQTLDVLFSFKYNRVDGFIPQTGLKFQDADSVYLDISFAMGVATALERNRFHAEFRQTIVRRHPVIARLVFRQEMRSDDDYLLPDWQNSIFALMANVDYKNHYEVDGLEVGIEYHPIPNLTISGGYLAERWRGFQSSPELWSLFGGKKQFLPNFAGVDPATNSLGFTEINDHTQRAFLGGVQWRFKNDRERPTVQLSLDLNAENSRKGVGGSDGDFSFGRYTALADFEYRTANHGHMRVRSFVGESSRGLPLYRSFFIGGYGFLRGFDNKEFNGTGVWAASCDYGASLAGLGAKGLRLMLFYDCGAITKNGDQRALLQSVGVGLSLDRIGRLNLARRLDRSDPSFRLAFEF